jgi:hypothetical protein
MSLCMSIEIPFSDDEIERFRRQPGGRSLDEILRDLEKQPDSWRNNPDDETGDEPCGIPPIEAGD